MSQQTPAKPNTRTIRRRIIAHISASPMHLSQGGVQAATWSPQPNKVVEMFGCHNLNSRSLSSPSDGHAVLSGVRLCSCSLLETHSTFPTQIGVTITAVPPCEATNTAHAYAFTVMPNSHNPTPLIIYEADVDDEEQAVWHSKYPMFTASNIETHDTLTLPGENYIFIDKNHPVIEVLRQNRELLNKQIDQTQLFDGRWYKVGKAVFTTCCEVLKQKILNNIATCDLNHFNLQIHRVGDRPWQDYPQDLQQQFGIQTPEELDKILNTPLKFTARLELKFEINTGVAATSS